MSNVIAVVVDSATQPVRWPCSAPNYAGHTIREVLQHAGFFFDEVRKSELPARLGEYSLILLPWDMVLGGEQRSALARFVSTGGCLLGIGGTSGLDDVFGCAEGEPLTTGHVRGVEGYDPITAPLDVPPRVFGGRRLITGDGEVLAVVVTMEEEPQHFDAVVRNRFGEGSAIAIGPDIVWSVLHMQQGLTIVPEHVEGYVCVEKGMVLSPAEDRQRLHSNDVHLVDKPKGAIPDDPYLCFFEPMADRLRELFIRCVLSLCRDRGISLPLLWYWPAGQQAIAHMSHDTEGNVQAEADHMLRVVSDLGLSTTWCIRFPGGYEKEFYPRLIESGCEIALHYDSQTRQEHTCWSPDDFRFQHEWLRREAGIERVTSNKNHYLRWEGRLELYRWCLDVGIELDETKGANHTGFNGFPFGGCHPWFPADDAAPGAPPIDVLEVNLMTQDLIVRCPVSFGKAFVDRALDRCGIAHFLFHPPHVPRPEVEAALREIVSYARDKGLDWWPAQRINTWERGRRRVQCRRHESRFTFTSETDLGRACLLFLGSADGGSAGRLSLAGGRPLRIESTERHGFPFDSVVVNLEAGAPALTVTRGDT